MNTQLPATAANQKRLAQAQQAWAELLTSALERGFHGAVALELTIQDGTIQHLRRRLERLEK